MLFLSFICFGAEIQLKWSDVGAAGYYLKCRRGGVEVFRDLGASTNYIVNVLPGNYVFSVIPYSSDKILGPESAKVKFQAGKTNKIIDLGRPILYIERRNEQY